MDYFKRVAKYTPTRFWVNNVTRRQADLAIAAGAVGCTKNPAYLSKVMGSEDDGIWILGLIDKLIKEYNDDNELIRELQRRVIAEICAKFLPLYRTTCGKQGYVSIQADPFSETTETILDNAIKSRAMAENFIIKIPATKDGITVMSILIREQIPVLATEVMSMDQVITICEMHKQLTESMHNPAPFYFAHINGIFDEQIHEDAERDHVEISSDALRLGSYLLGKKMMAYLHEHSYKALYMAGGARDIHHFTNWVGADACVTINWKNTAEDLIKADLPVVDIFHAPASQIMLDELLKMSPNFRKSYIPGSLSLEEYEYFAPVVRFRNQFEKGWTAALATISARRK